MTTTGQGDSSDVSADQRPRSRRRVEPETQIDVLQKAVAVAEAMVDTLTAIKDNQAPPEVDVSNWSDEDKLRLKRSAAMPNQSPFFDEALGLANRELNLAKGTLDFVKFAQEREAKENPEARLAEFLRTSRAALGLKVPDGHSTKCVGRDKFFQAANDAIGRLNDMNDQITMQFTISLVLKSASGVGKTFVGNVFRSRMQALHNVHATSIYLGFNQG